MRVKHDMGNVGGIGPHLRHQGREDRGGLIATGADLATIAPDSIESVFKHYALVGKVRPSIGFFGAIPWSRALVLVYRALASRVSALAGFDPYVGRRCAVVSAAWAPDEVNHWGWTLGVHSDRWLPKETGSLSAIEIS